MFSLFSPEGFSWSLKDLSGGLSGFNDCASEALATNKILDKQKLTFVNRETWIYVSADSFDTGFYDYETQCNSHYGKHFLSV
jgi:hypothetical protein